MISTDVFQSYGETKLNIYIWIDYFLGENVDVLNVKSTGDINRSLPNAYGKHYSLCLPSYSNQNIVTATEENTNDGNVGLNLKKSIANQKVLVLGKAYEFNQRARYDRIDSAPNGERVMILAKESGEYQQKGKTH